LPKQIFGHPWLLQGDGKMSKSRGNVLYADELVDVFGVDAVRYFCLHEMPFDNDGAITWELMVERLNSELANTLGNLVNRTIAMTNKYFGGTVNNTKVKEDVDDELIKVVLETYPKVVSKMDQLRVADAMTLIFTLFKRCNKYIDETMPWILGKDDSKKERLATVLYNLVESICIGANLLEPFMPETSEKILNQLNGKKRTVNELTEFGNYPSGTKVVEKAEILFARLDVKEVIKEVEEKKKTMEKENEDQVMKEENQIDIPQKEEITFDEFMKMQFQVGEIISCEAVPKSRKLLCSQVKIGGKVKQIVSGIKANYTPEEMVGKKVMVLVNLKPAKLAGVLSEGMLLCAEDENGNLSLMVPEREMPQGAEIM
jgi:methionyl-tRNA synthetase